MKLHDAIVVGSGAAGGWAAKELAEAGLSVLVLEAGPHVAPRLARAGLAPGAWMRRMGRHYLSHRQSIQELHPSYWLKHPDLFVDDEDDPYETSDERRFNWIRGRQVGGRTHLWGGLSLRLSELELGGAGGAWRGWPVTHADLDPWYARVERFLRMEGGRDGLRQLPDGAFEREGSPTIAEARFAETVAERFPGRRVIGGRGIDDARTLEGAPDWSLLTSVGTTLHAALATGRVTLRPNAVVSHLVHGGEVARNGDGARPRAAGVAFVDRESGAWEEAQAKLVVLCASTVASVRILLSTAARHPELAPDSDVLGRYLMDHVTTATAVELPRCPSEGHPRLTAPGSILVPRWANLDGAAPAGFAGGFGLWGAIQRSPFTLLAGRAPSRGFLVGHGEMEPVRENRVELTGDVDRLGVDRVRIEARHSDNDRAVRQAMRDATEELVHAAGGRTRNLLKPFDFPGPWRWFARLGTYWKEPAPGSYVHEVGGARMGDDPRTSIVDRFNRCWHVPNVYVTDGAAWPTSAWQGPTLTIMALTARACAHAVDELRGG